MRKVQEEISDIIKFMVEEKNFTEISTRGISTDSEYIIVAKKKDGKELTITLKKV